MIWNNEKFSPYIFTEEEIEDIITSYKNGESSVKIGKRYNISHKPILKLLHKYNIDVDQKRFVRKYNVDEHYFDIIDNQEKAYILGFLAADGCNFLKKSTISMSLEECDRDILERIRTEMNNEHPLEFINYTNKHDFGYTYKNQYRMLIFSTHMCNQLIDKGIVPNKSYQLSFPDFLDEKLLSHYIRGVFDGDGSIGFKNLNSYKNYKKPRNLLISITSTYDFNNKLSKYLLDNHNIESKVTEASNHNGITSNLSINKKDDAIKFLNWIYKNANIYLKRKYEIFEYYNSLLVA